MKPSQIDPNGDSQYDCGVVYKKMIGNYAVHAGGRIILCALSSRLREQPGRPAPGPHPSPRARRQVKTSGHTDPVAIGDRVCFIDARDGTGLIVEVLPRRNKLSRRAALPMPSAHPFEQVIVANLDQVVPVFSAASPPPRWNLLDRYLVSAESAGLPALICITKLDLVQGKDGPAAEEMRQAVEDYRRIGYPLVLTSALTGAGLDQLGQALDGRFSVFLGKSGVGKTSLLNTLQPGLGLRVQEVSQATGKGRHTTTHLEMFPLESGGAIVDTPGVREFGLWDVDEEDLALFFPEMRPFVGRCKFGLDCSHDDEPGCALRKAVMAGQVSPRRYQSYLRLKADA